MLQWRPMAQKATNKKNKKSDQQRHSLFVGRWQPFHKGHQKLIETVLKQGKPVVIAIRDTEISHKDPYLVTERWQMIQRAFKKYHDLVKIIVIPDIDEICYGREVGYTIRRIDLDEKTHLISGTATRKKNPPTKDIIWLTGQSGAGKTTLAEALREKIQGSVILDGDEMRESISKGAGFSKEERHEHNLRVARLAKTLSKRQPVIVSVIAPFQDARDAIEKIAKPVWVYVKRALKNNKDRPYEVPLHPDITLDAGRLSVNEEVDAVLTFLTSRLSK